jgi:hypothetical protein
MDLLDAGKHLIERGDLAAFQEYLAEVEMVDWAFQKLYLHACLKGRREIAEWLEKSVFPTLDPIVQIALRQGFAYGRHLLRKAQKQ